MEREAQGTSRMQSPTRLSFASTKECSPYAQSQAACWLLHPLWTGLSQSSSLSRGARKLLSYEKQSWRQRPERDSIHWLRCQQTSAPHWGILPVSHSGVYSEGKIIFKMDSLKERNHLWHEHQRTKIMWVEKAELLWHVKLLFPQKNNALRNITERSMMLIQTG